MCVLSLQLAYHHQAASGTTSLDIYVSVLLQSFAEHLQALSQVQCKIEVAVNRIIPMYLNSYIGSISFYMLPYKAKGI